jgi:cytochrome c551/c552
MTKPQIWIAAFLFIFLLLFAIGRMTQQDEMPHHPGSGSITPQTDMSASDTDAASLIGRLGCITCHGVDLNGTQMGPPLQNISQNWKRDDLINYLRNPNSYMSTERFKAYQEKYPNVIMPPFNHVDVKELGRIADYLLQR